MHQSPSLALSCFVPAVPRLAAMFVACSRERPSCCCRLCESGSLGSVEAVECPIHAKHWPERPCTYARRCKGDRRRFERRLRPPSGHERRRACALDKPCFLVASLSSYSHSGSSVGDAPCNGSAIHAFLCPWSRAQSVLGGFLDPLADKVMVSSVALALGHEGVLPAYLVVSRKAAHE